MRRVAEWLLLPLFLLPVGVALGLHLWVGRVYEVELSRYESGSAGLARQWLAEGGAGHRLLRNFDQQQEYALRLSEPGYRAFHVSLGARRGKVFIGLPRAFFHISPEWRLAETFPAGLTSDALADPQTRLALETGQPDAAFEGLDASSRAFVELLDSPEIRRLARESLPAATKLYLVRRWRRQGVTLPQLASVEEALVFLTQVERALIARRAPFSSGVHVSEGVIVLAQESREPIFARPPANAPRQWGDSTWFEASDGADGLDRAAQCLCRQIQQSHLILSPRDILSSDRGYGIAPWRAGVYA